MKLKILFALLTLLFISISVGLTGLLIYKQAMSYDTSLLFFKIESGLVPFLFLSNFLAGFSLSIFILSLFKKINLTSWILTISAFFCYWVWWGIVSVGLIIFIMIATDLAGIRYQVTSINNGDSMAPTISQGSLFKYYFYNNFFTKKDPESFYKFKRGDIVGFSNEKTKQVTSVAGVGDYNFVKRIIGIPGDKIELRNGYVSLNGKLLSEPYTLVKNDTHIHEYKLNNITFEPFINECEEIIIPDNKLFVLGDNREYSDDSRVLGLIDFKDVIYYFPYKEQMLPFKHGVNIINFNQAWRTDDKISSSDISQAEAYCTK